MNGTPWTSDVSAGQSTGTVSLVEGTSFMVSGRSGNVSGDGAQGLFVLDTRVLSRWVLSLDGAPLHPLTVIPGGPFSATLVGRAGTDSGHDASIAVIQRRYVGQGMREDIEIRNHGPARTVMVELDVDVDFAGLFEVKAGHALEDRATSVEPDGDGLVFGVLDQAGPHVHAVSVRAVPPGDLDVGDGSLRWAVRLDEGGTWSTCVSVRVVAEGAEVDPTHQCGEPCEETLAVSRLRQWHATTPTVVTDHDGLRRAASQALDDLGSLRIFDPRHTDRVVVAAGAPWFMALFGRDSLLTSWMALPFDQALARGVLAELADQQGSATNRLTEEQPGRILHEVRFDRLSSKLLGGATTYYGTADATPLFVMLVAELARWTGVTGDIVGLMPAVDRALAWIDAHGDRDGDGFVEYLRSDPSGLEHQGWKDSWDGIRHADGSVATPPIALSEVQGYVYAAFRARAWLARALGQPDEVAAVFDERAALLRARFDEAFWLDELGRYAIGLDHEKAPIASSASNVGHLLWSGIVPHERAAAVAAQLVSPAMFSGWGIRTLAADARGYNPLSYHCGSVWPHDTAIAIAGLAAYGCDEAAQRIALGLLDAATASGGRLPELFGGFSRDELSNPVPYPTSCSPQAWSAASPLLVIRALLGFEPDVTAGTLAVRPRLPDGIGRLSLHDVRLGEERLRIDATRHDVEITGGTDALHVNLDLVS